MRTLKESFGIRLKELRKNRKLTQEMLAEKIGVNQRQLTRIENGENFPSSDTMEKLCIALEVHPQFLFQFDSEYNIIFLNTGTDSAPVIKSTYQNETMTIKSVSSNKVSELKNKSYSYTDFDKSMLTTAKRINDKIIVDITENKKRAGIKVYYPDGTVEDLLTPEISERDEIISEINKKLKLMSLKELEFVKLAIDAPKDKSALKKLQTIMDGVSLSLS